MAILVATILSGIVSVFSVLMLLGFFALIIGDLFADAPFVPLPRKVMRKVAALVQLREGETFYDVGSGNGKVVRMVSAAYPGARCVGIEKAPVPFLLASVSTPRHRFPNARFIRKNFFSVPFGDASVIFTYLMPKAMQKLAPKLEREMKPGTRIISCEFPISGREPHEKISMQSGLFGNHYTLYVYTL